MISIKAGLAITLFGLGGAAMGSVAYLEYGKRIPVAEPELATPAPLRVMTKSEAPPDPVNTAVSIEPVVIYGRIAHHETPLAKPPKAMVVCSGWRSLGPVGHGVRALCIQ